MATFYSFVFAGAQVSRTTAEMATTTTSPLLHLLSAERRCSEFVENLQHDHCESHKYMPQDHESSPQLSRPSNASSEELASTTSHHSPLRSYGPLHPPVHLSPPNLLLPLFGHAQRPTPCPPQSPAIAALTFENLLRHTQALDPDGDIIMPRSPTKSRETGTTMNDTLADSRIALETFGLQLDSRAQYPAELQEHLQTFIHKLPSIQSPAAGLLKDIERIMRTANETTLVLKVAPLLLFKDRLIGSDGEHSIRLDANVYLRQYLVNNGSTQLTQPRPDICVGYVRRYEADGRTMAKFTTEEETVLLRYNASTGSETLFPFVTGQAKSAGDNYEKVVLQTARDALALSRSMINLCNAAGVCPTVVDPLHWSITCNAREVALHIHWNEQQIDGTFRYHMKEVTRADLGATGRGLSTYRAYLRNILDYALNQRVARLKELVQAVRFKNTDSTYVGSGTRGSSQPSHMPSPSTPPHPQRHDTFFTPPRLTTPTAPTTPPTFIQTTPQTAFRTPPSLSMPPPGQALSFGRHPYHLPPPRSSGDKPPSGSTMQGHSATLTRASSQAVPGFAATSLSPGRPVVEENTSNYQPDGSPQAHKRFDRTWTPY